MGEQRCAGRWGTPVGLQLPGLLLLLLLWMASMAFLHRPVCYRLPPCSVGAQAVSLFMFKERANVHGSNHQQMASSLSRRGLFLPRHVSAAVLLRDPLGTPPSCPRP